MNLVAGFIIIPPLFSVRSLRLSIQITDTKVWAGRARDPAGGDDWRSSLHQVGGALPRAWEERGGSGHQEVGQGNCQEAQDGDQEM